MSRKVTCKNSLCKYHTEGNACNKSSILIDEDGCQSFEKNLHYYFNKVWNLVNKTNMIMISDLTEDRRIGLFYVMKTYNLSFSNCVHGGWQWISLVDEDKKSLKYEDIIARPINMEAFQKIVEDFNNGILPTQFEDEIKKEDSNPKVDYQPYGWLAPNGDFYESDWGEHEEKAFELMKQIYYHNDEEDAMFNKPKECLTFGDWLYKRNWVLIDNPCGDGGYNVTYRQKLTKYQKDFLYGYFCGMGNQLRAEQYLEKE